MSNPTYNLVYNGNFTYFSNQDNPSSSSFSYRHPDGWIYQDKGSGGSITKVNNFCAILTSNGSDAMNFTQNINEFPLWEKYLLGKTISATIKLSLPIDCIVDLSLGDNINSTTISISKAGDHYIQLTLDISNNAKNIFIQVSSRANSATIYIESIFANLGEQAVEHLPCIINGYIGERRQYITTLIAPPTEISLCEPTRELNENQTRLNSVINYRFGTGANGRSLLPDMRGYFSRAFNNSADRDPDANSRIMLGNTDIKGDLVGSYENDDFLMHSHDLKFSPATVLKGSSGAETSISQLNSSKTESIGGKETRPKNVAELYTIKWA